MKVTHRCEISSNWPPLLALCSWVYDCRGAEISLSKEGVQIDLATDV